MFVILRHLLFSYCDDSVTDQQDIPLLPQNGGDGFLNSCNMELTLLISHRAACMMLSYPAQLLIEISMHLSIIALILWAEI